VTTICITWQPQTHAQPCTPPSTHTQPLFFHVGDGALVVIIPKKDLAMATSYLETLKTVENLAAKRD